MRRAKMAADDAVRRAEFHRALEIMESLTQNKIAAKKFQDYIKKLKDIDAIVTPQSALACCCCHLPRRKLARNSRPPMIFSTAARSFTFPTTFPSALEKTEDGSENLSATTRS